MYISFDFFHVAMWRVTSYMHIRVTWYECLVRYICEQCASFSVTLSFYSLRGRFLFPSIVYVIPSSISLLHRPSSISGSRNLPYLQHHKMTIFLLVLKLKFNYLISLLPFPCSEFVSCQSPTSRKTHDHLSLILII